MLWARLTVIIESWNFFRDEPYGRLAQHARRQNITSEDCTLWGSELV